MVKEEKIEEWVCPHCECKYDNYDDAYECIKQCTTYYEPDYKTKTIYVCEMCGHEYNAEYKANRCEKKHKKNDDIVYNVWLDKKNREVLDIASKHPQQTKLIKI